MKDINENEEKKNITFSPFLRFSLFCILLSVEMITNGPSGILSSSSKTIKSQLNLNDKEFGMFGSALGIGKGASSLLYTLIVNKFNLKWIYLIDTFLKGCVLISNLFTNNAYFLIMLRGFDGLTHMPLSIYVPIWIDQYAFKKHKSTQLTMYQVVKPFGKVVGYIIIYILGEKKWKLGFSIVGFYLWIIALIILFYPEIYFNKYLRANKTETDEERNTIFNFIDIKKSSNDSIFSQIFECLSSLIYNISNLTRCIIQGFLTSIHYWCADYMRNALNVNDSKIIFGVYTFSCLVGPIGGALLSGFINHKFGNYEGKNAPKIANILQIIATILGVGATFVNDVYSYMTFFTLFLCFNSVSLSLCHGFVMVTVRPQLKAIAYSIANISNFFFFSALTPFIYGYINDYFAPKGMKKMGMRFTMGSNLIGVFLLIIFDNLRQKQFTEMDKNEKLIENGKELENKE